ncbi:hypothetical protein CUJ83_08930 [Methanocella sp. CWC-04]|uniref:Transglutaminase-like domain-containing protein n=1 Tax=Methanooceanicella nereidis TaxID=2052831 RepID=A0AAP2RFF0_9EURY|nr:transglutaminase domain-containing protein [Methanocella sp. CWC-04]MCD1295120.1 hypothetical protein [Methanocella sp. CWC-04]
MRKFLGYNIRSLSALILIILIFPFFTLSNINANAETIVVDGSITANNHVTERTTITLSGLDLAGLSNGSRVTYNAPIYTSYQVNGFSQSVSGFGMTASPAPSRYQDMTDSYGNGYRHYEWDIGTGSGSSMTFVITTSFNAILTGDASPVDMKDSIGTSAYSQFTVPTAMVQSNDPAIISKKNELLAGASTQAEAVERIIDFVKINIPVHDSTRPKDAVSSLNDNRGNCVNRAHLALALIRSAGIPARYVSGQIYDNTIEIWYRVPEGLAQRTFNWDHGPHAWIEVYYAEKGVWVPYDPYLTKGFVDNRHIKYGVSVDGNIQNTATHGEPGLLLVTNINPGAQASIGNSLTISDLQDDPRLQYVSTKTSPEGGFMISRDLQSSAIKESGISLSLSNDRTYVNSPVSITASITPARSDGVITIRSSADGISWDEIASGSPSLGRYTYSYAQNEPGQKYFKASWSGAGGYPGSESQNILLTVINRTATPTPCPTPDVSVSPTATPDPASQDNNSYTGGQSNVPENGISKYSISGFVMDSVNNGPIMNAVIYLDNMSFTTDNSGSFNFSVNNGTYVIKVVAEGYGDHNKDLSVNGNDLDIIINMEKQNNGAPVSTDGKFNVSIPGFEVLMAMLSIMIAGYRRQKIVR